MRSVWLVLALAACAAPRPDVDAQARIAANNARIIQEADKVIPPPVPNPAYAMAREDCAYRGAIANATAPGGIVGQGFAGIEVQAACMQFYQRTGRIPG